jgi:TetR/AcrR family transcriptional regulator, copper-responsive repressor
MTAKPRGRPRAYDPQAVLQQVLQTFWCKGYVDTSLDDLCEAAGVNKASLYAGLGDKAQLYRLALQAYVTQVGEGMQAVLDEPGVSLADALRKLLARTVALYQAGRGCFMVSTAPMVAWQDEAVRTLMQQALAGQAALLAGRFERAQQEGEVGRGVPAPALAGLVAALMHSLSLRARAGVPEAELVRWAGAELALVMAAAAGKGD